MRRARRHRRRRAVSKVLILIDGQHAVRRKALHGEGTGNANLLLVLVGLVVEVLKVSLGGDGGVDGLLAGDALLPPLRVEFLRLRLAISRLPRGEFPTLPTACRVRNSAARAAVQDGLILLPDHVDFSIVGNGLERNVGNPFIDKALSDVPVAVRWQARRQSRPPSTAHRGVCQK